MLGVPNAKGEMVPFDITKITDLPAFKTGMRAIESTAIGKKLSTQQAERAANFGADFFGQRIKLLDTNNRCVCMLFLFSFFKQIII